MNYEFALPPDPAPDPEHLPVTPPGPGKTQPIPPEMPPPGAPQPEISPPPPPHPPGPPTPTAGVTVP